jgi:hypothetical protein
MDGARAIFADVDQRAADFCTVDCEGRVEITPSLVNGVVAAAFPAALPEGLTSCELSCAPAAGADVVTGSVDVFVVADGVTTRAELAALAPTIDVLVGSISITTQDLGNESLGHAGLRLITGELSFRDIADSGNGTVLSFPLLLDVGSFRLENMFDMITLSDVDGVGATNDPSLPLLRNVLGDATISGNSSLASLGSATDAPGVGALPSLETVSGALTVSSNSTLASLALPSLETVSGQVSLTANGKLVSVVLTQLVSVGTAGGTTENFDFSDNAADPGALGNVEILLPDEPARVGLFGQVRILNNRRLTDALATTIATHFTATNGVLVSGNVQ